MIKILMLILIIIIIIIMIKKNNKNIRYNKLNCWNTRKYKGKIL